MKPAPTEDGRDAAVERRLFCLELAVQCRAAGTPPDETIRIARDFEAWVLGAADGRAG